MGADERAIGFFATDLHFVVHSWDLWMERATGIAASAARGQPLGALVPQFDLRGLRARFERVVEHGSVEVLAPAFHRYLIPCPPQSPSPYFEHMQQRVTIMPQREGGQIVGTIIAIEDVTARRDEERQLADQLTSTDEAVRARAMQQVVDTRDSTSGTVFLGALSDMRWHARRTAVSNLAQGSDAALIDTLMYALRTQHQNPSVLNSVLQVLALTKVDVVPALIASMESADSEVREYTALALGQQRDRRAVPVLLRALD